jgi:superfamily II DNA or RNA helicase
MVLGDGVGADRGAGDGASGELGGLLRGLDPAVIARGQAYAAQGRVHNLSSADGGKVLLAQVVGTAAEPYHVLVQRGSESWTGRCSCPVRQDCKHVAAVVLAHEAALARPASGPQWRTALSGLREERSAGGEETDGCLGVGVALSEVPAAGGRGSTWRVLLRPVRLSRAGRWVRLSGWDLGGGGGDLVPRTHLRLAQELVRLDAARSAGFFGGGRAVVALDDLGSEGWRWLTRAAAAGIPLLSDETNRRGVVTEVEELVPVLEIRRREGELVLQARCRAGEQESVRVSRLGSPVHSVVVAPADPDAPLRLQPIAASALPVLDLLEAGEVFIPPEDEGDFVLDYLPHLRDAVTILSPDGSVEVGEPVTPRLVLRLAPGRDVGIDLRWGMRYALPGQPIALGAALPLEIPFAGGAGRDRDAELRLLGGLEVLAEVPRSREQRSHGVRHWMPPGQDHLCAGEAVAFVERVLPVLRAHPDVDLEEADGLPVYARSEDEPEIEVVVADAGAGVDWFDLTVTITVGAEQVPVASLIAALRRGEQFLVLPSGTWFPLDRPELEQLRLLLEEAQELEDGLAGAGSVRLTRYDLGWFAELESLGVVARQCAEWDRLTAVLRPESLELAAPPPAGLQATLRPYQLTGYQWLRALLSAGLGGILADDMGLGKTVQTLAAVLAAKEEGTLTEPVLVVAPTSVVGTWASEAARFAPDLQVVTLGRTARVRRRSVEESLTGPDGTRADLVITSYAVARIDADQFAQVRWRALVLDEAHQVKNHQSQTYAAVRRLQRATTIAVSGTPVENSLMDLWTMLSLTAPGMFPKPEDFRRQWRAPIEAGNADLLAALRRRIRPLLLRRTKDEVALDLPPKQVQLLSVALGAGHQRVYDRVLLRERQRVLGLLDDPEASRIAILASLTRLRQLALDPVLVPSVLEEDAHGGSSASVPTTGTLPAAAASEEVHLDVAAAAKTEALVAHVRELAAEGHRALVFSQFTRYLRRVQRALEAAGIETCYLDGSTSDREAVIASFRAGTAPVFLISLKAGGVGLTLTEADYVFVLDPWWNPAAEAQAIDRAHRIGQDKPVMVYRMVSAGTIEERVIELQDRKRALASRIVDDDPFTGGLTPDDLGALLGPRTR